MFEAQPCSISDDLKTPPIGGQCLISCKHGTWKSPVWKGNSSSSNPQFLGPRLSFWGVYMVIVIHCYLVYETNKKNDLRHCSSIWCGWMVELPLPKSKSGIRCDYLSKWTATRWLFHHFQSIFYHHPNLEGKLIPQLSITLLPKYPNISWSSMSSCSEFRWSSCYSPWSFPKTR